MSDKKNQIFKSVGFVIKSSINQELFYSGVQKYFNI